LDTRRGHLTAYLDGRVVKRWPYQSVFADEEVQRRDDQEVQRS